MLSVYSDEYYMKQALLLAQKAFDEGEVPIGAVIVTGQKIIGKGYNQVERLGDATAHAEMIAISAASGYLGSKVLEDCTLYVTIEPCPMCAGALYWSRIGKIIYGASEPKFGFQSKKLSLLHPKTEISGGLMDFECREIMQRFFLTRRS
ncbi:MAG: nucleoside deaminase [Bacteroidia bacterium]|nr:nucleoside deaminase [Bacteroidia bacterium]